MPAPVPREIIRLQEEARLLRAELRDERRARTLATISRAKWKQRAAVEAAVGRELRRQLNASERRVDGLLGKRSK